MRRAMLMLMLAATTAAAQTAAGGGGGASAQGLQIQASSAGGYDSNLRDNNAAPLAGGEYQLGGDIRFTRVTPTASVQFRYEPYGQFFPVDPGLNSLNQIGTLAGRVHLSPRWSLNGAASGGYMEMLPPNTATGLQTVLSQQTYAATPRTREVTADGQLGTTYQLAPRWQATLSGEYNQIEFPSTGVPGLNAVRQSQGAAGLTYEFSPRTQAGVEYIYTNASLGASSHLAADALLLNWRRALTPLTSLQLEAGPEYSQVHDQLALGLGVAVLTANLYQVRTYPRLDATLQSNGKVPWTLRAEARVSSGIGALPLPAELVDGRATVGPRLPPGWQLQVGTQVSQLTALSGGQLAGRLRMATAGFDLHRRLDRHLSLEVQMNYLVQRGAGLIPLAPDMNQNLALAGLSWSWRPLPLPGSGGQ